MMFRVITALIFVAVGGISVSAQPADSTDSAVVRDSVPPATDSPDTTAPPGDSLADTSAAGMTFEERYERYQKEVKERPTPLSYLDSLVKYFASPRLNLKAQRDRSFYHDAGDYFRFDPSYFVLEGQATPWRKTVQPFGLAGDRMNLVINRMDVHPFQHVLQPDGLIDFNYIPTTLDDEIYIISGPAGRLFGGRQVVASLVTLPKAMQGDEPSTAIMGDKGDLSYSWVRGRFSRQFRSGRHIDASVGYREADDPALILNDDSYNYVGNLYFPVGGQLGLRAAGQLYNRDGRTSARPEESGVVISRDGFDRHAELSVEEIDGGRARYDLGYRYDRQGSFSNGAYSSRYNFTGHGGFATGEWMRGQTMVRLRFQGEYGEFESYDDLYSRSHGDVSLEVARLTNGLRFALVAGGRYDEEFSFLPDGVIVLSTESSRALWQLSVGYAERAPSLYELFLPYQRAAIYSTDTPDYANQGNRDLKPEKQMTAGLLFEYGSLDNAVRLSVTAGEIADGIDWHNRTVTDSVPNYTLFYPDNGDIRFVDAALSPRFRLSDLVHFLGGGAYHYIEYDGFDDKPYTPEYQFFSGLELHYRWEQKLLDLFAYGELVYVGPYHGYVQTDLGKDLIANAKLSLGLKDFRFHLVFQNLLNRVYRQRDYINFNGAFFYYGLVWNFND